MPHGVAIATQNSKMDIQGTAAPDQRSQSDKTDEFEQLAEKTGCAAQIVEDLYRNEFQLLHREARVRSYIPVLAMKRVRDRLRKHHGSAPRNPPP